MTSLIVSGPSNACVGVRTVNGAGKVEDHACKDGVILNVPIWSVPKILETTLREMEGESGRDEGEILKMKETISKTKEMCSSVSASGSFMHCYLGVPINEDLDGDLECHHSVILDASKAIDSRQNMVIISIPTVFDKSLAPDGYHVIHAYTAATEDFEEFKGFVAATEQGEGKDVDGDFAFSNPYKTDYSSDPSYSSLKSARSSVLFDAIERVIPDIRERCEMEGSVVEIGTPLTHRRFNRRGLGAYGPGVHEDGKVWNLLSSKSIHNAGIPNVYVAGDCAFPGIGIPGVAASGTIAANSFVGVKEHLREINRGRKENILQ